MIMASLGHSIMFRGDSHVLGPGTQRHLITNPAQTASLTYKSALSPVAQEVGARAGECVAKDDGGESVSRVAVDEDHLCGNAASMTCERLVQGRGQGSSKVA